MKSNETDWVLMAAHELRGTLASVESFLDAAVGASDPDQAKQWVETARSRSKCAVDLIDHLLFLERFDSDRDPVMTVFDLAELIRELAGTKIAECKDKEIRMDVDLPEPLPVRASRYEMEMLFSNLIQNGIKYNRRSGKLRISAERKGVLCRVMVMDEGVGIQQAEIGRIFEGFYRTPSAVQSKLPGVGLGLAIVMKIVNAYSGKIEVQSEPGRGSVFTVTLPLSVEEKG
jgi:two-component system, OmpR family, phosphate regulon sensor histidine kinase PhoR